MSDYRYTLHRTVSLFGEGRLCWVMLNPSTANDWDDDPTIRRVTRFTIDAGYASAVVVNLFAYRATKPAALAAVSPDAVVGQLNTAYIRGMIRNSQAVVCAWGAHPAARGAVMRHVVADEAARGVPIYCLGTTRSGEPRHPLYVRADQPLVPYEVIL